MSFHPCSVLQPALRAAGLLAAALASGCAIAPPDVRPGESIAQALELAQPVAFRLEGLPRDVAGEPGALSAADAVQRALQGSAVLQAALARVRAVQLEAELAGLFPNPILSVALRVPAGQGLTDVDVGLGADLLAVLQRADRADAAGHRLQAEAAAALSTALDVVAEAQAHYAEVQVLEALLPVLEQRLALFARLQEVAAARLELGAASRHELTALQSGLAQLEVELSQRRLELRVARLELARCVGEPSAAADWSLQPWTTPGAIEADEAGWIAAALAQRPELAALCWELQALGREEQLAGGSGSEIGVEAEREDGDWSVGPAFAVPLSFSGAGGLRRQRAEALTAEVRHRLTEAERRVVLEVRSSLMELAGASANLQRLSTEIVPLQERRRDDLQQAFELGQLDVTALLLAERSLQDAHAQRIELERDVSAAHRRLQRAVGGPRAFRSLVDGTTASLHTHPGEEP